MAWLQGGPFLEVSFLLRLDTDRRAIVDHLLRKLKNFTPKIEFVLPEKDLEERINAFNIGYPFDDNDPDSVIIHSLKLPINVDTDGKRKSILTVEQISTQLLRVGFWFYGSVYDVPEWEQRGISESQLPLFKHFLNQLFTTLDFPIGMVAYEMDVLELFDTDTGYPDESYHLENISHELLRDHSDLVTLLINWQGGNLS